MTDGAATPILAHELDEGWMVWQRANEDCIARSVTRAWRTIDDCPSDGSLIWIAGGGYDIQCHKADGDWWRFKTAEGFPAPTHWCSAEIPAWPPDARKS